MDNLSLILGSGLLVALVGALNIIITRVADKRADDKPQINTRVSYRARFILNDGTNLLDREFAFNRPITLYDTDGDIAGSMRLEKDAIMFYFTKSVNEYYCNGLLFRF